MLAGNAVYAMLSELRLAQSCDSLQGWEQQHLRTARHDLG